MNNTPRPTFDRILALSAFDGDSSAALRTVHAHFSRRFPDCSLALLLVLEQPAGQGRLTGLIGPDGTEHVPNVDPLGHHTTLPLFDDALAARLLAAASPQAVRLATAERALPLAQALLSPATLLALPIANAGKNTHFLVFGSSFSGRFEGVDLGEVLLECNLATSLIVRPIATRALREETVRQRQAIEGLADVQKLLLPDRPAIRGLGYALHWQPAETAAGDYYDLAALTHLMPPEVPRDGADVWAVLVADVSGHGAAAAMEAVQFDAILRTYRGDAQTGPAGALTYANRYFFSRRQRQHFLTALALAYRPDLRRALYVSAGHPPLLHRRGNVVTAHGAGEQIPLGILRDYTWTNSELAVEPGDIFVLYTDGIIEARDRNARAFGEQRLIERLRSGPDMPEPLLAHLRDAVIEHQGSKVGTDDQTLIVLRIAD